MRIGEGRKGVKGQGARGKVDTGAKEQEIREENTQGHIKKQTQNEAQLQC